MPVTEQTNPPPKWQLHIFLLASTGAILGSTMGAMSGPISSDHEHFSQAQILHFVCKPLATFMIVNWCFGQMVIQQNRMTKYTLIGMLLSLLGDIFLMIPRDFFILGLISFLSAHVAYLIAFTADTRLFQSKGGLLIYSLVGGIVYSSLWDSLNPMLRVAVAAYILILISMASQLFARWRHLGQPQQTLGAIGGLLFVISDGTLAINKFLFPFPISAVLILSTYWAAQYFIFQSIRR